MKLSKAFQVLYTMSTRVYTIAMARLDRLRGFFESLGKKKEPELQQSHAPQDLQDGEWHISYTEKRSGAQREKTMIISIRRDGGAKAWIYSIPLQNERPNFEEATVIQLAPGATPRKDNADSKERDMLKYIASETNEGSLHPKNSKTREDFQEEISVHDPR